MMMKRMLCGCALPVMLASVMVTPGRAQTIVPAPTPAAPLTPTQVTPGPAPAAPPPASSSPAT
ncbi:MAG: hypothetical protein WAW39_20400, partial [Prosthecobacter sp.]